MDSQCIINCLFPGEGRAGGYKELDEEDLEETKRRQREAAEVRNTYLIIVAFDASLVDFTK